MKKTNLSPIHCVHNAKHWDCFCQLNCLFDSKSDTRHSAAKKCWEWIEYCRSACLNEGDRK